MNKPTLYIVTFICVIYDTKTVLEHDCPKWETTRRIALQAESTEQCSEGIRTLIDMKYKSYQKYTLLGVEELNTKTIYAMMKDQSIISKKLSEALCNFMYFDKMKKQWIIKKYDDVDYSILNIALDMDVQIMFHPSISKEKYQTCGDNIKKCLHLNTDKIIYNVFGERNSYGYIDIPMLIGIMKKNENPRLFCFVFPGSITVNELLFIQKTINTDSIPNLYLFVMNQNENDKVLII